MLIISKLDKNNQSFLRIQRMTWFGHRIAIISGLLAMTCLTTTLLGTSQNHEFSSLHKTKFRMIRTGVASLGSLPTDQSPRVLIAEPCSGSSATIQFTAIILRAHGFEVMHGGQPLLRPKQKNRFYADAKISLQISLQRDPTKMEILSESFVQFSQRAAHVNKIFLFKANKIPKEIMDTLESLNAKFAFTYRRNTLDRAICSVRDCFLEDRPIGHEVYVNGTESDLCFGRRESNEKVMAEIDDVPMLFSYMEDEERTHIKRIEEFSGVIAPSKVAAYEDLFAFEYMKSQRDFRKKSVKHWRDMLRNYCEIREEVAKEASMP